MEDFSYTRDDHQNIFKKMWQFLTSASHSRTLGLIGFMVLAAALPVAVFVAQSQQSQDLRQQASADLLSCEPKIYTGTSSPRTSQGHVATIPVNQKFDIAFDLGTSGRPINVNERVIINFGPMSRIGGKLIGLESTDDNPSAPGFFRTVNGDLLFISANGLDGRSNFVFRDLFFSSESETGVYTMSYTVQDNLAPSMPEDENAWKKYQQGESNPKCNDVYWAKTDITVTKPTGNPGSGTGNVVCTPHLYIIENGQLVEKTSKTGLVSQEITVQAGQELAFEYFLTLAPAGNSQQVVINFGGETIPGFDNNTYISAKGTTKKDSTQEGQFWFEKLIYPKPGKYTLAASLDDTSTSTSLCTLGRSQVIVNVTDSPSSICTANGGTLCTNNPNRCTYACGGETKWSCENIKGNDGKLVMKCFSDCTTQATEANALKSCPVPSPTPPAYGAYTCNAYGTPGHCAAVGSEPYASKCAGSYAYQGTGCSAGNLCYTECPGDTPVPVGGGPVSCQSIGLSSVCKDNPNKCYQKCDQASGTTWIVDPVTGSHYADCNSTTTISTCPIPTGTQGATCTQQQCASNQSKAYFVKNNLYYADIACSQLVGGNGTLVALATHCAASTSPSPSVTISTSPVPSGPSISPIIIVDPANVQLALTIGLMGTGAGGDATVPKNQNPIKTANRDETKKPVQVQIYQGTTPNPVHTANSSVTFDQASGLYKGTLAVNLTPGFSYTIKVKVPGYLRRSIGKSLNQTQRGIVEGVNKLPSEVLFAGDITGDNKVTIEDYNEYLKCVGDNAQPTACNTNAVDLNNDGKLDSKENGFTDYNLLLRGLREQNGD